MKTIIALLLTCLSCQAALQFNGSNSVVNLGDRSAFDGTTKLGVMFWVNVDATMSGGAAFLSDLNLATLQNGWACQKLLGANAVHIYIDNAGSNGQGDTPNGSLLSNSWHHVAFNFDGTATGDANRLQVYIDAVNQSLTFPLAIPSSIGNNSDPLHFGTYDNVSASSFMKGMLDDVVIIGGDTFTAAEVTRHFQSHMRRLIRGTSEWELATYPNGASVNNLQIIDTKSQFNGLATNCVSVASFLGYP